MLKRYQTTASSNFLSYSNEEFDRIFALAVAESDDAAKIAYYKQLQEILTNDAASVYIQDPASYVAVGKKLAGYTFYPVYVQDMSNPSHNLISGPPAFRIVRPDCRQSPAFRLCCQGCYQTHAVRCRTFV